MLVVRKVVRVVGLGGESNMMLGLNKYFKLLQLSVLPLCAIICLSCAKPEESWKESFRSMLIEGHTNFKAPFADPDRPAFIFQYQLPRELTVEQAFEVLLKQNSEYGVVSKSKTELLLRNSAVYTKPAFDEYRFYIDENKRLVTAMSVSFLVEDEARFYKKIYLKKFYEITARRDSR